MIQDFITEEIKPQVNADKHRFFLSHKTKAILKKIRFLSVLIGVHLWLIFLFSCNSKPTDLRSLAPAETLVYLETNNLGGMLETLTENKTFQAAAKKTPDFSAVKNVQFAVAVTGFEASEKKVTDENSVLNFTPHFVAIADTHAWNWQAISLTENQITDFVKTTYGEETKLEISDKADGKWFVWTADDRKVFAFVAESRIFFGNDAAVIEKCIAVKKGEVESLAKNENLSRAYLGNTQNNLAFGYVSPEGVAQISNLAGVSVASGASEEAEQQSFIARVLPQILRNTTREIIWTANKTDAGIEDKLSISLNAETASVFKETLVANAEMNTNSAEFLPTEIFSVTRYNPKNPQLAWRSLILTTAKNTDAASGNFLVQFSRQFLESYGITDAETFLGAVDSDILTARFDSEGEKSVVVATVKDAEKLKLAIAEINFKTQPENQSNAQIWRTQDKLIAAAFVENILILGDSESVLKCLQARQNGQNFTKSKDFQKFAQSRAIAASFSKDADSTATIVEVLSAPKDENKRFITEYSTETRITEKGFERKTISDFGFVGEILEKFKE